ncbi:MAG: UDP-glucose 6-dehydrogenase [Armatimonadetes bacterium CG07_land_8_20_14_0_80_40_9]|nr:MAG: UDP-glucose 6-dehydrogenase [Armatimonadetes bacterium CG07_land_8_20_14_0_80_40_9]
MNICIVGCGHVGLVTAVVFADYGNEVIGVDNDEEKVRKLKEGVMPIFEPGLKELVDKNVREGRLSFSSSIKEGVESSKLIFICVGTPPKENGEANLYYVEKVSREIAKYIKDYQIIVEKSTVPVETGEWVERTIRANNLKEVPFDVVSNPEFLREGQAISDAKAPQRIVIGTKSKKAIETLTKLYEPFNSPLIICDIRTAEVIKHASNAFLATKVSFINALANICEKVGADVTKVAEGMGYDSRIGRDFLEAGIGYGGFCFPKDLAAFIRISQRAGYDFELLKAVERINEKQRVNFVEKIKETLWILDGKTLGILGLSFKPNTDDLRFAPSVEIIPLLQKEGAKIKAFDPQAMESAKGVLSNVEYSENAYEVARDSDALIIITEWDEFKHLDLQKVKSLLKSPVIIDGRNIYKVEDLRGMGFNYVSVGR